MIPDDDGLIKYYKKFGFDARGYKQGHRVVERRPMPAGLQ